MIISTRMIVDMPSTICSEYRSILCPQLKLRPGKETLIMGDEFPLTNVSELSQERYN